MPRLARIEIDLDAISSNTEERWRAVITLVSDLGTAELKRFQRACSKKTMKTQAIASAYAWANRLGEGINIYFRDLESFPVVRRQIDTADTYRMPGF